MLHSKGRQLILAAFLLCASLPAATTVIDCGSSSDQFYSGGSTWLIPQATLTAATPDATLRFGTAFSYHVPVGPGSYSVTLRFVEPIVTAAGARIFSVSINGTVVADRLDLIAIAGFLRPYVITAPIVAVNGTIDISLTTQTRSAVISSIEIVGATPPPPSTERPRLNFVATEGQTVFQTTEAAQSVEVYRNGLLQTESATGGDYTSTSVPGKVVITFLQPLPAGDKVALLYFRSP